MVTQVTPFSEPLPDPYNMTSDELEISSATFLSEFNPRLQQMNAQSVEVEQYALDTEASGGAAANAKWEAGNYTQGEIVWSPTDSLDYRCKVSGNRTIDPVLDPANWALRTKTGAGGSDTTSSAVDITLTSTSGRLQIISMTAASKKVTLPSATTLNKGTPLFVIKNSGSYRFSVHENGGAFTCYVQPGQVIAFSCSDISSAAGVWHASGMGIEAIYDGNTPEVLNAVDSRDIAGAMMSATKAICVFRNNVTGYLWGVILNYGSSSGAPVQINAEASEYISIAAQTSNQATVVYKTSTGVTKGYVLDNPSGNTITPGAVRTIDTSTSGQGGTGIVALTSTKLICFYGDGNSTLPKERVLDIASSAITESAEVDADTVAMHANTRRELGFISSTKVLIAYKQNGVTATRLRLQAISGSTPAPLGSSVAISNIGGTNGTTYSLVILSTARAVLIHSSDLAYADLMFSLLDISGSTPVLLTQKKARLNILSGAYVRSTKLDANNIYVSWSGGGSGGVDAVTVRITAADRILIGNLSERIEPGVTAAEGYLACFALDSTHVMQVCRNASTFLSAKTIEIS